jgi:hypothetical protein
MSYTRDKDAHMRGVGSVAARDGARPRAAARRIARVKRALATRDRIMAGLTYGPNGGLAGLGAVNIGGASSRTGILKDTTPDGGTGGRTTMPVPGQLVAPTPAPRGGGTTPTGFSVKTATSSAGAIRAAAQAAAANPYQGKVMPGGIVVDPGPGATIYTCADGSQVSDLSQCSVAPIIQTTGTTGGGGGGGDGSGATTGGGTAPTLTPPSIPDEDIPEGSTGMSTTEKIVIAAAALGGLYLLFGRKKGQ